MSKMQTIGNRLKDLLRSFKRAKKVKPIKKNTLRRRLRAWNLRNDRRQQQRIAFVPPVDETVRTCNNCALEYTGRVCPQCGQVGTWNRFTWRQMFLNFLDIWGLGNRPMYRTLRDLFVRPGYMARDYLEGQRQYYFPPFKLLALVIVLLMFISLVPGIDSSARFSKFLLGFIDNSKVTGVWNSLANGVTWFLTFLSGNPLYDWLFFGVIAVFCIWIAFHSVSRYNFVETYIFLVFVLAQRLICDIPNMLAEGFDQFLTTHSFSPVITTMGSGALFIIRVGIFLFATFTTYLLFLNFKQFYQLSWKSTILRMLLSLIVGAWLGFALICVTFIPMLEDLSDVKIFCFIILALVLIPLSFWWASRYFNRCENEVSPATLKLSKGTVLLVLLMPLVSYHIHEYHINIIWSYVLTVFYVAAIVGLSFLPIILYKKFHRTWITFIPLLLLLVFFFLFI